MFGDKTPVGFDRKHGLVRRSTVTDDGAQRVSTRPLGGERRLSRFRAPSPAARRGTPASAFVSSPSSPPLASGGHLRNTPLGTPRAADLSQKKGFRPAQ
jgi:hypothetical protein